MNKSFLTLSVFLILFTTGFAIVLLAAIIAHSDLKIIVASALCVAVGLLLTVKSIGECIHDHHRSE